MHEIKKCDAWVTNSHAQNTQEEPLRLLVDWVTCSFYFTSTLADLKAMIGLAELDFITESGARYKGYVKTHSSGAIEILESEDSKFMLNFRGQACRLYEENSKISWVQLFAMLIEYYGAKFTRLDIAIDDFTGIYQVSTIRQAVYKGLCVTRLKEWGNNERGLIEKGYDGLLMDSFYLGGSTSRYHLNIYDKKLEREGKGKEVTEESWTRTEVRFKNEYATNFATIISKGNQSIGYYVTSFLNEKIQFLKPGNYTNKSRSAKDLNNISRWWKRFLGNAGKLNLSLQAPDRTLDDVKEWLVDKISPSIAMVYEDNPEEILEFLNGLILNGRQKFNTKHYSILENAQKNKNDLNHSKYDLSH